MDPVAIRTGLSDRLQRNKDISRRFLFADHTPHRVVTHRVTAMELSDREGRGSVPFAPPNEITLTDTSKAQSPRSAHQFASAMPISGLFRGRKKGGRGVKRASNTGHSR